MADRKPYFVRLKETGNLVRIVATSPEDALAQSDKIDVRTTPIVVARQKDEGSAVLQYPDGREILVGPSISTSNAEKIAAFKEGATAGDITGQTMRQAMLEGAEEQSPFGRLTGPIVTASQASGFGAGAWLDELVGQVFGGDSARALRVIKEAQQAERPVETLATQLGVGLSEGYALLAKFPQLANILGGARSIGWVGSASRAALASAAGGSVTGLIAGTGEATPEESRLEEGAKGAIVGGVTAGVLGAAAPLVSAGGRNVADIIRKSDIPMIAGALRISQQAAEVIKNAFQSGGNVDRAVANLERAGELGMLADAGEAAQALLDAAASAGGQARETVSTALTQRAEAAKESLSKTLDRTLGSEQLTPTAAANMIAAKTSKQRKEAYDLAYSKPIDYASQAGMNIETVLDRVDPTILDQAVKKANAMMRADGKKNQQVLASIGDDGEVSFTEMPNVIQLDYIKRALNSIAEGARGALGQATDETLLYGGLARDLRNAINSAVPEYGEAARLGGEKLAEQNAFKLGREALKPQTEIGDVLEELGSDATIGQIESAKLGMRQYIRNVLDNVKSVPSDQELEARQLDAFYRLTSSDAARNKISAIMGDEADDLFAEIDKVAQTARVRSAVALNSKTAQRQAIQRDIEDITGDGVLGQLMRGKPVDTAQEIVQAITGRTDQYDVVQRQKIFAEIARALTQTKGDAARSVIDLLDRASRGQVITQAENDLLVNEIVGTLSLMGRGEAQRQAQEFIE
jgi:hypothetical protein